MKTKRLFLTAFAALTIGLMFTSCDKIKTDKFDGSYTCYTTENLSTNDFAIDKFTASIELQVMDVDAGDTSIDGIDVDNDGNFSFELGYSVILMELDYDFTGTITEGGDMSGTLTEKFWVLGVQTSASGTFSN